MKGKQYMKILGKYPNQESVWLISLLVLSTDCFHIPEISFEGNFKVPFSKLLRIEGVILLPTSTIERKQRKIITS